MIAMWTRDKPVSNDYTRLRVAEIEPVGGHGGMDYYDFGLCEGLTTASVKVVLYTSDKTSVPKQAGYEVKCVYSGVFGTSNAIVRGLRYLRGTVLAIIDARRSGASLVHFHFFDTGPLEFFNVFAAKLAGFPIVITVHDVESFAREGRRKRRARFLYRRADVTIVHNEISRKELVRIAGQEAEIAVIPHGNYVSNFDPSLTKAAARTQLGFEADAPLVLFFGQIKKVKGVDLLIEAWRKVVARIPEARLLIAGRPWKMHPQDIVEQIGACDVSGSVEARLEYIPAEDALSYYAAADAVVLPYRKIYQSGVLLMAMSLRTPVLASDIDGMAEVIDHGRNGMLFRTENVDDLARNLVDLLEDDAARMRLSDAAFSDMQEFYNWIDIGMNTACVFHRMVEKD